MDRSPSFLPLAGQFQGCCALSFRGSHAGWAPVVHSNAPFIGSAPSLVLILYSLRCFLGLPPKKPVIPKSLYCF